VNGYTRQPDGSWLADKPTFLLTRRIDGTPIEPPISLYTRITDPEEQKRELGCALWQLLAPWAGEHP
jgi:hypothetical protein